MVDPGRLMHARLEAGLSTRQLADLAGIPESTIRTLEKGNSSSLQLWVPTKVADCLGVAPADLSLQRPLTGYLRAEDGALQPADADAAEDAKTLEVLLHTHRRKFSIPVVCEILKWDRSRLEAAVKALDTVLVDRGLKVHKLRSTLSLAPRFDAVTSAVVAKAERYCQTRMNLNWVTARALYATLDSRPEEVRVPHRPTHYRGLTTLARAGLIEAVVGEGGWRLSEDVRFSFEPALKLQSDRRPAVGRNALTGDIDDALWRALDTEAQTTAARGGTKTDSSREHLPISRSGPIIGTSRMTMPSVDHLIDYLTHSDSRFPFFSCMVRRALRLPGVSYSRAAPMVLREWGASTPAEADQKIKARFRAMLPHGEPPPRLKGRYHIRNRPRTRPAL